MSKTPLTNAALHLGDNSIVQFGAPNASGVATFHDYGFMPITSANVSIGGLPGGLYLSYDSTGTQHFSPNGVPTTADYSSMHYKLVAYIGKAQFGHVANGAPTVSGIIAQAEIGHGDLISGHLSTKFDGSVSGNVTVGLDSGARHVGSIDISVAHAAGDMRPVGPGAFTIDGGSSRAMFSVG